MKLNDGSWPGEHVTTALEMYVYIACAHHAQPLMPLWRRPDGKWLFWCPVLTTEGRCGDHANRPDLCRNYDAMTDGLCVLGPPGYHEPDYKEIRTKWDKPHADLRADQTYEALAWETPHDMISLLPDLMLEKRGDDYRMPKERKLEKPPSSP